MEIKIEAQQCLRHFYESLALKLASESYRQTIQTSKHITTSEDKIWKELVADVCVEKSDIP